MSIFVNTIDVVGDENTLDALIGCSILEFKDNVLTSVWYHAFYSCADLRTVILPNVTSIDEDAFYKCTNLEIVDLTKIENIEHRSFVFCSKLVKFIIRSNSVPTLDINVFASTPIASGTGYIYVPRALVDSYKAATNWSAYANQFRALEDYTVDGTTTGELDPTKI